MVLLNSKTIHETRKEMPEKKLWRAVLNQALEDGFGLYNTYMCDYEKKDAELFFRVRTHRFDEICEMADIDSDSAWKKIQKIKLIQKGIVRADKEREIFVVQLLNEIKQQRYYRGAIRKKTNCLESNSIVR